VKKHEMDQWVKEGRLEYLGHRDDIYELIVDSEVVVLPSYREGTPRSLLEAASLGRPIITTDVPGCREVVIDRKTGFLCMPFSGRSLADKCFEYIAMSRQDKLAMGRESRKLAESKFDEKIVIDAYIDKIKELT
jgi:glycosyltransferase involved in cell wall biosynthesis